MSTISSTETADLTIVLPGLQEGQQGIVSLLLMGSDSGYDEDLLLAVLPEGLEPPADVEPRVFDQALQAFLQGERLDMQSLAAELGISRSTLYRRVSDRDELLGHVLWYATRQFAARALMDNQGLHGRRRIVATVESFFRLINDGEPFQQFLDNEPEAALRILTSSDGHVQPAMVGVTRRLIDLEAHADDVAAWTDRQALAYVIVRIGESFLYADVIASGDPDLGLAIEVIDRLLQPTAG